LPPPRLFVLVTTAPTRAPRCIAMRICKIRVDHVLRRVGQLAPRHEIEHVAAGACPHFELPSSVTSSPGNPVQLVTWRSR
jgi:hypothetical protein